MCRSSEVGILSNVFPCLWSPGYEVISTTLIYVFLSSLLPLCLPWNTMALSLVLMSLVWPSISALQLEGSSQNASFVKACPCLKILQQFTTEDSSRCFTAWPPPTLILIFPQHQLSTQHAHAHTHTHTHYHPPHTIHYYVSTLLDIPHSSLRCQYVVSWIFWLRVSRCRDPFHSPGFLL